jgi:hypothetical protein
MYFLEKAKLRLTVNWAMILFFTKWLMGRKMKMFVS